MTKGIEQSIGIPFPHVDGVNISLPRVSVIVCNYNQGRFIKDAILSIAQQYYTDFECVVIDDKSTDDSVALIRLALDEIRDSRFRFIEREQNGGQMAAMLTGLDATSAPFVAFVDADDIWLPSFVETHIGIHLNSGMSAAMSCSNLAIIDSSGILVAGNRTMTAQHPRTGREHFLEIETPKLRRGAFETALHVSQKIYFVKNSYSKWIWSATSGMLFRRATLEAIRPEAPEDYRICADYYLATFSHIVGGSLLTYDAHGYYRIHGTNMWAKNTVLGEGTVTGTQPRSVSVATHRAIIVKLLTNEFLRGAIPAASSAATVHRLARRSDGYQWIFKNPLIKRRIPARIRFALRMRQLSVGLKSLFRRSKRSGD